MHPAQYIRLDFQRHFGETGFLERGKPKPAAAAITCTGL